MEPFERLAVIASLIVDMNESGSWTGETHVQKAMYIAERMGNVDLGHSFILYKHGPFSFDLSNDISLMYVYDLVEVEPVRQYGPKMHPGAQARQALRKYSGTVDAYRPAIRLIAQEIGERDVHEMEAIGTAAYVTVEHRAHASSVATRAKEVVELKPHVSTEVAERAVQFVDRLSSKLARQAMDEGVMLPFRHG
jgi:uncharacterized protein YwgA